MPFDTSRIDQARGRNPLLVLAFRILAPVDLRFGRSAGFCPGWALAEARSPGESNRYATVARVEAPPERDLAPVPPGVADLKVPADASATRAQALLASCGFRVLPMLANGSILACTGASWKPLVKNSPVPRCLSGGPI